MYTKRLNSLIKKSFKYLSKNYNGVLILILLAILISLIVRITLRENFSLSNALITLRNSIFFEAKDCSLLYVCGTDSKIHCFDSNGKHRWESNNVNIVLSSIVFGADGTLYFINSIGVLYAYNNPFTSNGKQKWRRSVLEAGYALNLAKYCNPVISNNGTIYVVSNDNYLYAVNSSDGTEKWLFNLRTKKSGYENSNYICTPILDSIDDNIIYLGDVSGNFYAIRDNGNNATLLWKHELSVTLNTSRFIKVSSPVMGTNRLIYFNITDDTNSYICALRDSGNEVWNSEDYGYTNGKIIFDNDIIYIASNIKSITPTAASLTTTAISDTFNPYLYSINANTGAEIWSISLIGNKEILSSPTMHNNNIILYSGSALQVINSNNGNKLYTYEYPNSDYSYKSIAVDSSNTIYTLNNNFTTIKFDKNAVRSYNKYILNTGDYLQGREYFSATNTPTIYINKIKYQPTKLPPPPLLPKNAAT